MQKAVQFKQLRLYFHLLSAPLASRYLACEYRAGVRTSRTQPAPLTVVSLDTGYRVGCPVAVVVSDEEAERHVPQLYAISSSRDGQSKGISARPDARVQRSRVAAT